MIRCNEKQRDINDLNTEWLMKILGLCVTSLRRTLPALLCQSVMHVAAETVALEQRPGESVR